MGHGVDVLHNLGTGAQMKAEKMFLALMRSKGFTDEDFKMNKGRYTNPAMQSRWSYFLAGWEMRGVMPQEMRDVL